MTDVLAVPGAARFAGSRVARVEDARLLTGEGTFVDDVQLPGMLHARFVRSPHARAKVGGVDVSAALAVPGVVAVFTGADLNPGVGEQWHSAVGPDAVETPKPALADDEVRYVGDPVALVVAEDRYVAEDAAELVVVSWEPLPAVVDYTLATTSDELVFPAHAGNVIGRVAVPSPAADAGFERAEHVVEATFRQHGYAAVPMETRGIVVDWSATTGELTIHATTQVPHEVRLFASRLLGIPEHRIRVVMRDTGGGFGQKAFVLREELAILVAARRVPGPLKWIEDRQENLVAAGKARHEQATAAMAFDADGTILGARIEHLSDAGAYPTPSPVNSTAVVSMLFPGPYRVPAVAWSSTAVHSNTTGKSPYRGPWQFESVVREVLLDTSARQLGIDPIELRRRNLLRPDELPYASPTGFTYDHVDPLQVFEHALELLGYDDFRREQAVAREQGRHLGVGTCTYIEPTTAGFGVYATEGASIRIEPSGTVNVYLSGGSAGNSIETTAVQLVADELGVDLADVHTIQGDTALTPPGGGTCGSRSGSMTAGAVAETAGILRERILRLAAHRLEANVDDLELAGGGRVSVKGTPSAGITYAELARIAYFTPDQLPPDMPAALEATARYNTPHRSIWAMATHACTCEVDVATGQVRLLRYVVSEDCGTMINPNVVEGQIAGGTVQGIGGVLLEHLAYDDEGNPLATTFVDYLLPTTADVPTIEYGHVVVPGPGPGGYKGVGEGGAIGAPPAVINAVADALSPFGVEITEQPLSPDRIVALLEEVGR